MPEAGEMSAEYIEGNIYVFIHGKYVCRYSMESDTYVKVADLPLPVWFCFGTSVMGSSVRSYIYITNSD